MDCSWSDWVYEECDCDAKVRLVTRVQYEEEYGGKPCEGESQMSMPCDETECPGTVFIEIQLLQWIRRDRNDNSAKYQSLSFEL